MDTLASSSTPDKEADQRPETTQDPDLALEIEAWAELLVDYYEYKRKRKIDADRNDVSMESKVDQT